MSVHPKTRGYPHQALALLLASGLFGLCAVGLPALAHGSDCRSETLKLGPGEIEILEHDIVGCDEHSPLLVIEGPVTVNLGGHTISCALLEDGLKGTGIVVIGSEAEVRNGKIVNCDRGVVVDDGGMHTLTHLTITSHELTNRSDNTYDQGIAFQVISGRNYLAHNRVIQYAGEGFRLDDVSASRNTLSANFAARNANHAFRVASGENNLFISNVARRNRGPKGGKIQGEGFRSQDRGTRFVYNIAHRNGDEGFRLRDEEAQENLLIGNTVTGNGLEPCDLAEDDANPGISVTRGSSNNEIGYNTVKNNCIGIFVSGESEKESTNNGIFDNTVRRNTLVDVVDGNSNCDGNVWRKNTFKTRAVGPDFNEDPECIR